MADGQFVHPGKSVPDYRGELFRLLLDRDGLPFRRGVFDGWEVHIEDPVLVSGPDIVVVDLLWHSERPAIGPRSITAVVLVFSRNRQTPFVPADLDVIAFEPRHFDA